MIIISITFATIWLSIAIGPIDGLPQTTGQDGTFFVGDKFNKEHQLAGSPIKIAGETIMVGLKYLHGVYSNKTRKPSSIDESDEMITAHPEKSSSKIKIIEKRSINAKQENQQNKSNQAERLVEEIDESASSAADDTAIRDGIAEYSVFNSDIKERQKTTFRELNEDYVETR